MTKNKQITSFQGLRFFAFVLVFISHIGNEYTKWLGAAGVSLFIILSGFLLYLQHADNGINYKTYVLKRIKRFYPLHILTLLISLPLCYKPLAVFGWDSYGPLISNLLLVHSFVPLDSFYFSFNTVSWYLSLTLFFACISPAILWAFKKVKKEYCAFILLIIMLIETIYTYCFLKNTYSHWLVYICPIFRALDFAIGVCLGRVFASFQSKKMGIFLTVSGGLSLIASSAFSALFGGEFFSTVAWALPSSMIIVGLFLGDNESKLIRIVFSNKFFVFLGGISFEMFMIHKLLIQYSRILSTECNINRYLCYLIAALLTFGFAVAWSKTNSLIKQKRLIKDGESK